MKHLASLAATIALLACGADRTEPVTRIGVEDLRERQARRSGAGPGVLQALQVPQGPGRIIYEPPMDLTLRRGDTAVTAPFGITAAPDSAGQSPTAPAPGRRSSARRDSTPR